MVYTKEDLTSDIPRIRRKAQDYFDGLKESGLLDSEPATIHKNDYSSMKKSELKEILEEKGMKVSGLKSTLIKRLQEE